MIQIITSDGYVYGNGTITIITGSGKPKVISGGGSSWGAITGTLSAQTDLDSALNAKQDTLVSSTNIKTVNGASILGAGDLIVSGGLTQQQVEGLI